MGIFLIVTISTNAEKLRAVAEGMQKAIDDKFRDRLTNTAKRAREAALIDYVFEG